MSNIDWIVLVSTILLIIGYGIWKTRGSKNIEAYLLGNNEAKWWTVGLSVMATQASAITFLSTPGQAYNDGMGFAQFYFMLPVAMIIICITFIPLYYKLKVYTAYEFLEGRFDLKTRSLTSLLFLVQRGLAAGITIYAPAIILSSVLGWNLNFTAIIIGFIAILYTVSGGTNAVHVTHKYQMIVILTGLFIIFFILINHLTQDYSLSECLSIAKANDKLDIVDLSFDWNERYNIWSSMAALFLFLSYFGTDQSQVQRYISGKSISESRIGLIMNGILKVPLQFFILLIGVLVFLFFQTTKAPLFFNQSVIEKVTESSYADAYENLEEEYDGLFNQRLKENDLLIEARRNQDEASINTQIEKIQALSTREFELRNATKEIISSVDPAAETNDKDYVFLNFIQNYLPKGLIGLLFAVIFFAAMSSTASELNALASTTTIDIYKRNFVPDASDSHYVFISKCWTAGWGIFAILFAANGSLHENLIQFVNIIGSIFYGTILGIFLVAFYFKKIKGNAVFYAALLTEGIVIAIYYADILPYLWLNLIGVIGVIGFSHILKFLK